MAKLAYYASRLPGKEHWLETPEGFRVYTAVPICRTGYQEYLGREIKKHPDYDPAWNISDEDVVQVYRPLEVVTAPETVASYEGKPVTDNHPPDDVALVLPENDGEYSKGHMQNVRVGEPLEEGETPLLADLHVRNKQLNDKIDGGVRDVSSGYVYGLARREDGTLVTTSICGNHEAVVPKGRAGPEVSIRDAAIDSNTKSIPAQGPEPIQKTERKPMKGSILGRMLKAFAADAEPEEVEEAAKHLASKAARDAEPDDKKEDDKKEEKKAASDESTVGEAGALHPKLSEMVDSFAAMKDDIDAIKNHIGLGEKKDDDKKEDEGASTGDANVLELEGSEQGKAVVGDSAEFLKLVKPIVAASKDKALRDAYSNEVARVKGKKPGEDDNAYADFANATAHDAASAQIDYVQFFNGVSHAEGQRRLEAYQAKKGNK